MARRYNRPLYLLDVPVRKGENAEQYVAFQLEDMARQLETITGRKLTTNKIEEVFENSNRARGHQLKVNQLRREVPSPLHGEEGLGFIYLVLLGEGHPRTPEIYRTLAEELENSIKSFRKENGGNGAYDSGDETFRLIWMHLRPYYSAEIITYLEKELRMKIVMEEFNQVYWPPLDPSQPFLSLARKVLSHPGLGPIHRRLDTVEEMVEQHRAHGVVHFSHWGCRHSVGGTLYLRNRLRKKGIPFLSLEGDCVDEGSLPWGQARTRLEGFQEMLEQTYV